MSNITTEICKKLIVEYCQKNKTGICNQFVPSLTDEQFAQACKESNWKRRSKSNCGTNKIERMFDCKPFDDQLRAYVLEQDGNVVSVIVQGE